MTHPLEIATVASPLYRGKSNYGLRELSGDRGGRWAMTVARNWRLTFIKLDEQSIAALDLEDYH